MSAELGGSDDPRALVPGDPAAVGADARALAERAADAVRTGEALRRIETGAWTGPASDAWRTQHDEDAVRWFQGADSLDAAARALAGHADALARAQDEASRAVALWRAGEATTADVARRVAAGEVAPPVDPGDGMRHDAVEILAAARAELRRSGDQVATALHGEAALAPRDSLKQADADFYGGIWDSISEAAAGVWTLVSDPAVAVAGAVQAAAHPMDAAKDAIAYDDWAHGREARALGRNTGDVIVGALTLGAGKITSALGRGARDAGEVRSSGTGPVPPDAPPPAAAGPDARSEAVRGIVLDANGRPHGREDSKGVFLVDASSLAEMRRALRADLGAPDAEARSDKGERETWMVDPASRSTVTYRSFSSSGGATIDITSSDGLPVKRFHIEKE